MTHQRHALLVTCLANAIEWYDFAVYGAMASVLTVVLLPPGSGSTGLVAVFAVFATTFLARPVGALLIGVRADRSGRRPALVRMVLLMSGATAAIGLLPAWSVAGLVAPFGLVLLRLVQGFASGGEITTSITLLLESAPRNRWGRYGGWHTATVALGIAGGIGAAGVVSAALSQDQLHAWGWRIPFLVALPLGMIGLVVRRRLRETLATDVAVAGPSSGSLGRVWRGHRQAIRTGFVLVAVLAGTVNMWFVFLPVQLGSEDTYPLPVALACAAAGLLAVAAFAPALGALSDRVGRRPLLAAGTASLCVLIVPAYLAATEGPWPFLLVADVVVACSLSCLVVTTHVAEQFPAGARATGVAMTFGLATAVVGGTAPLIGSLLSASGSEIGIPLYLVCLGVAGLVAVRRAPAHPFEDARSASSSPAAADSGHVPVAGDAAALVQRDRGLHGDDVGGATSGGGPEHV